MTWLVIASEHDAAARWAAERLRTTGMSPLVVITESDLVGAIWRHRVGAHGASTVLTLDSGRVIDSTQVRGTLNRLTHPPASQLVGLAQNDHTYGHQEISALTLSWLAALGGPTLNPPDPRGLSGAWRPATEWALLAAESGLNPLPVSADPSRQNQPGTWQTWPPGSQIVEDVIVVGNEVFSVIDLDDRTLAACRLLSQRANNPVLGLLFNGGRLAGATPLPNLQAGGNDLITALAIELDAR